VVIVGLFPRFRYCCGRPGQADQCRDGDREAGRHDDDADGVQVRGFVQRDDADGQAGERHHRRDRRQGDQRGIGLVGGLRECE
jgi:hypothetical protein